MEIQIDENVRRKARAVFERLNLTEEEAIVLFYKRTIVQNCLPFGSGKGAENKIKKKRMNERFAEWDAF